MFQKLFQKTYDSELDGFRLISSKKTAYLKKRYGEMSTSSMPIPKYLPSIKQFEPLLQNDYGEASDCSITSMTATIRYYLNNTLTPLTIYEKVVKFAKYYGYNGSNRGTNPLTIKKIFNQSALNCGLRINSVAKYGKGIGYRFEHIKNRIDNNHPVLLSFHKDGRNYQDNHTVTIVGYQTYIIKKTNKPVHLLYTYDNWRKEYNLIDFNRLSQVSSINYRI